MADNQTSISPPRPVPEPATHPAVKDPITVQSLARYLHISSWSLIRPPDQFSYSGPPDQFSYSGPPDQFSYSGPPDQFSYSGLPDQFSLSLINQTSSHTV